MRARGECGTSIAEGVPLGTGAVDALRWTPTVRVISPCAKKSAHTPHAHTRRERAVHKRTTVHAARRGTYAVTCTCVACGAVALCRHVYARRSGAVRSAATSTCAHAQHFTHKAHLHSSTASSRLRNLVGLLDGEGDVLTTDAVYVVAPAAFAAAKEFLGP